jgi:CheY-like chemotaxis protein
LIQPEISSVAYGDENTQSILLEMEKIAARSLRRDDDETLLVQSEKLIAVVTENNTKGARSMMNRIVEEIGRQMDLASEILFGTSRISVNETPAEIITRTKKQFAIADPSTFGRRVLVIDDEEIVLKSITSVLQNSHFEFEVESTSDAYHGCARLGKTDPDLVILDINMPGIDGLEVLSIVRHGSNPNRTKMLAMSGEPGRKQELLDAGFDDYIAKPFNKEELLNRVVSLLTQKKSPEQISVNL